MVGMIDQKIRTPTVSSVPVLLPAMPGRNPDSIGRQERMGVRIPHNVRYEWLIMTLCNIGMAKGAH